MSSISKFFTAKLTTVTAVPFLFYSQVVHASDSSLSQILFGGGIAIPVIIALSILALSVSIERLVRFRTKFIAPTDLVERVRHLWLAGEYAEIHTLLTKENSTLARAIDFIMF